MFQNVITPNSLPLRHNKYSPAAMILHLLLNNEFMSEGGGQVISQNKNIGARRNLCEICLLDFLNHRFTRMSC